MVYIPKARTTISTMYMLHVSTHNKAYLSVVEKISNTVETKYQSIIEDFNVSCIR